MEKRKNKKLKNEFKKLLNEQLSANIKKGSTELEIEEKKETKSTSSKSSVKSKENDYTKKDINKTLIIALIIIVLMFALFYWLKINNSTKEIAESILDILSI